MTTTRMTRQWNRWAGTIQDIERATRLAMDVLAPRTAEPRCDIEIATPGRVIQADSPDALVTEIDSRDLTLIRSVRIEVGGRRGPKATIHLERQSPSVTVEVIGEDRTRVEGLISQLENHFNRGKQRPGPNGLVGIGIALSAVIVYLGIRAINAMDVQDAAGELSPVGVVMIVLLAISALAVFIIGNWFFPGLEILEVGSNTRARRFRLALFAFLASVLASLAATVAFELIR